MTFLYGWLLLLLPILWLLSRKKQQTLQKHLLFYSLLFSIVALSRPVLPNSHSLEKIEAHDYIIALDASYSMQAKDIAPTRIEDAISQIGKLMTQHPSDRFTLFIFTSNALMISPPTTDTALSLQALKTINTDFILTKSTSLSTLFSTIATMPLPNKQLIIFSDGGEEQSLNALVNRCKKYAIRPYIIATATHKGAPLQKNGRYLKDAKSHIVVSKINPILAPLAKQCGGHYYEITQDNLLPKLSHDLTQKSQSKKLKSRIQSVTELYYYPLGIAFILFLLAVTKLHQMLLALLALLPLQSSATTLDFYYLHQAKSAFLQQHYADAAKNFSQMTPSVQSYLNTATSYYQAKQYRKAMFYLARIQSKDRHLQHLRYALLGNIAVQYKQYDKAKTFYVKSLALQSDDAIRHNLHLLYQLRLKTVKQIEVNLPEPNSNYRKSVQKNKKQAANQHKNSKENKNSKAKHGTKAGTQSAAQQQNSQQNSATHQQKQTPSHQSSSNPYQVGYSTYELINKGYANETRPW